MSHENTTKLKLIYRAGDSKPLRVYVAAELKNRDGKTPSTIIEFDPWKAASCADHSSASSSNKNNKNTGAVLQKTTSSSATVFIYTSPSDGAEVVKGTSMNRA